MPAAGAMAPGVGGPALAKRIRRFTILDEEPLLNNVLRGFKTLRVAVN